MHIHGPSPSLPLTLTLDPKTKIPLIILHIPNKILPPKPKLLPPKIQHPHPVMQHCVHINNNTTSRSNIENKIIHLNKIENICII